MSPTLPTSSAGVLRTALDHLERALRLLDDGDAPGDIGAHVDLAIHRLRGELGVLASDGNGALEPK